MLPTINQQQIVASLIHPIDEIQNKNQMNKQRTKKQQIWNDKTKIISFTMPQLIQSKTMVKKYKIRIIYQDQTGKKQPKTIFFGDQSDYVFNKDKNKRMRRLLSMKHLDNPLHPNYWKALLLNKYQTIQQGMRQFTTYYFQTQNQGLKRRINPSQKNS